MRISTYQPERHHRKDVHDKMPSSAEHSGIQWDKGLGRIIGEKDVDRGLFARTYQYEELAPDKI